MRIKFILFILIIIGNILFSVDGYGYSKDVHKQITNKSIDESLLLKESLKRIGLSNVDVYVSGKKIRDWIILGSWEEDIGLDILTSHFYNPLTNKGLTIVGGIEIGESAYNRANNPSNSTSWKYARSTFYSGLTAKTKVDRDLFLSFSFFALGHSLHLIQDVAVPTHTRNDMHISDPYESYTNIKLSALNYSLAPFPYWNLSLSPYAPKQFWDLESYNGSIPYGSGYIGLSEYTNANFASSDTIFSETLFSFDPHYFPFPRKSSSILYEEVNPQANKKTKYFRITKESENIEHFAVAERFYDIYEGFPNWQRFFISLDDRCHNDYQQKLIPRAVGYSAGLLNYFFRGNIDITRDSNDACKYVIQNLSNEKMSGSFGLCYDDASNNRYNIASWGLTVNAGGQSKPITLNIPDEAKGKRYILVFQGAMGNEAGAVAANANVNPFTSACGTELTISGPGTISRNTTQQYTVAGCTGCADDVTWTVSGTGASIDENGILTISNTACGTVRVKADCQKCNLSNFKDIKAACDAPFTITGPDTIAKNSTQQYTAEGCCGNVNWFVIGKGAVIDSNGLLTTDETACGLLTVIALCPDCDTFTIKDVKAACDSSLVISGSDTITKNSTQQYTTSGCCGTVEWSVTGKGTSISEEGLLTTDETACGIITVAAKCPDCETSATKDVLADCASSLTISGSDTITQNSAEQYITEGCCGQIEWTVTGTGASIDENGLLTTDETACGAITVTADCPDCNLSISKDVKVICDSLTITGSDTTIRNSTKQYTASGCCGQVEWSVSGKGANISSTGLLTAGATACGSLKVIATCAGCGTSATQYVRVTNAGQWETVASGICQGDHNEDVCPGAGCVCPEGVSSEKIQYNGQYKIYPTTQTGECAAGLWRATYERSSGCDVIESYGFNATASYSKGCVNWATCNDNYSGSAVYGRYVIQKWVCP